MGSRAFDTSIHAQILSSRVIRARNERAIEVRPEHSGPTNSLRAPCGSPPSSNLSKASIPVGCSTLRIFGAGVRADGILFSRAASIWGLIVAAEGINLRHIFAFDEVECKPRLHYLQCCPRAK